MNFLKKWTPMLLVLLMVSSAVFAQKTQNPPKVTSQDVSQKELKEFVDAYSSIRSTQRNMQMKIQKMIKDEGMSPQRFRMIMISKRNPKMADTLNVSDSEKKSMEKIQPQIAEMQTTLTQKSKAAIKDNGLTRQRFQAIAGALRTDKDLQQRFQKIRAEELNLKGGGSK